MGFKVLGCRIQRLGGSRIQTVFSVGSCCEVRGSFCTVQVGVFWIPNSSIIVIIRVVIAVLRILIMTIGLIILVRMCASPPCEVVKALTHMSR